MKQRKTDNIWEEFFDGHAPRYMENVFTRNTKAEVAFLEEELALNPGSTILDVGCGTGRHAVALAKRGFRVTGVDISSGMLAEARRAAQEAGVSLDLVHEDATKMSFERPFDAALCLCEGAFALLGQTDDPQEHDLAILRCIHAALKPGARLILGTLNAMEKIRRLTKEDIAAGKFDTVTLVETHTLEEDTPEGRKSFVLRERGYVATELALMLRLVGFKVEHVWGSTAGNWRREPPDPDEMELMVVARKRS